MTHDHVVAQDAPPNVNRLKRNSVGLVGVIFMAVATSAPITAMVGNVPIAVGSGNGIGAPAGYLVATIVLSLFSIGYASMAKHITATGAFYGYISHGLGRVVGSAAGSLITMAYIVFEASLIGIFAFFARANTLTYLHVDVHWLWFAMGMLLLNCFLAYFDINLTAVVLGIFLVMEIAMLAIMAFWVLFHGGGPEGIIWESMNPINAFRAADGVAGATAGLGLFFAFWSWVGFESSAMYGEESKDPKRVIPRAIMISVIGIGIFYVFVSAMAISAHGAAESIKLAGNADTSAELFFAPVRTAMGPLAVDLFSLLLTTGSFACGMAFHNCAARYIYALGREDLIPGFAKTIGRTHPHHGSPHIASFVQTALAGILILLFAMAGMDPYVHMYVLLAILGTMAILIVQSLCAFAVIGYFHVGKNHPETANWFRTFLAPLLGGIGMLYVVYLLWANKDVAAGAAADTTLFALTPWIVVGFALLGIGIALYYKTRDPEHYALIGRIVLDEAHERD